MKLFIKSIIVFTILTSCKNAKKDYLTISGKVENQIYDSIMIYDFADKSKRIIQLESDGSFKDTLKIVDGFYGLNVGRIYKKVFFQNGDEIVMNVDAQNYYETISFSGKGAEEINLNQQFRKEIDLVFKEKGLLDLSEIDFKNKMNYHFTKFDNLLKNVALDSVFIKEQKKEMDGMLLHFNTLYEENTYIKEELKKGKSSPKFVGFPNHRGGTVSLDDFKGKYVYINFWGTACRPCFKVLPCFKDIIEKYKNRNIEFVSISFETERSLGSWKKVLLEQKLTGVQLYADFFKDEFIKAYRVRAVPRYVLIDPAGNIVDAKTYSPSDPKLTALFDALEI